MLTTVRSLPLTTIGLPLNEQIKTKPIVLSARLCLNTIAQGDGPICCKCKYYKEAYKHLRVIYLFIHSFIHTLTSVIFVYYTEMQCRVKIP